MVEINFILLPLTLTYRMFFTKIEIWMFNEKAK
jgi:hypothetical protein